MSGLEAVQARAREAIWSGTQWLSAEEIVRRAPPGGQISASILAQWEAQARIFSLERESRRVYPLYACDRDFMPRAVIQEVLATLSSSSPRAAAAFFESTSRFLSGQRPRELVASEPERVAAHAHDNREWEEFGG
jgi:hypothetical protein